MAEQVGDTWGSGARASLTGLVSSRFLLRLASGLAGHWPGFSAFFDEAQVLAKRRG